MPELPEVEKTVLDLKRKVLKRTFLDVWTDAPKLIKKPLPFEAFKKEIIGKRIEGIGRKGKLILIYLSHNKVLLIHQKIVGHLLFGKWRQTEKGWEPLSKGPLQDPINRFIHLIFFLDDGNMLALCDLRKFARVEIWYKDELEKSKVLKELGPDALDESFTLDQFKKIIRSQSRKIKQVLMDQKLIAGIGNIYSSEILFRAKVHPLRVAKSLSDDEIEKIYKVMRSLLRESIKLGGESFSDYRHIDGSTGGFDKKVKVYRKEGKPCPVCGTPIERIKIGGRSAYFCPKCQK